MWKHDNTLSFVNCSIFIIWTFKNCCRSKQNLDLQIFFGFERRVAKAHIKDTKELIKAKTMVPSLGHWKPTNFRRLETSQRTFSRKMGLKNHKVFFRHITDPYWYWTNKRLLWGTTRDWNIVSKTPKPSSTKWFYTKLHASCRSAKRFQPFHIFHHADHAHHALQLRRGQQPGGYLIHLDPYIVFLANHFQAKKKKQETNLRGWCYEVWMQCCAENLQARWLGISSTWPTICRSIMCSYLNHRTA